MTNVAISGGAPAAILEWVQRRDDTISTEEEYIRIKVFGQDGKKYGDVELPYVPGATSIGGILARTTRPDGTVVPFKGEIYDKLLFKSGRTRVMARTFSMPDVQPGSILEYRYTRHWPPSLLFTSHWLLQRELPIVKGQLWFKPYEGDFSSYFTHTGLAKGLKPERIGDHYELNFDNVIAFEKEPFSPPEQQLKPGVSVFYVHGKMVSGDPFWNSTAKQFANKIEGFIGDRAGIKRKAQELVAGATTPDEKLRKIYDFVQQIQNTSYEYERSEQEKDRDRRRENGNVEDVMTNRYGTREQLTRLFVALCRAAGLDASDVAVAQRDEYFFSIALPDAGQLNGEIAMVNIGGKQMYFDPGTPYAPFGTVSWESTNVMGMRIARKSDAVWLEIPANLGSDGLTRRKADLKLENDVLLGTVRVTFEGQQALVRRLELRNDDEAAVKQSNEEMAKRWFPAGSIVKQTKVVGLKSWAEPVVVDYEVELPNLSSSTGTRSLVSLSVFEAAQKNPFAAERRKYPVYFNYPFQDEDEVTLHVPDGYAVESVPKGVKIEGGALGFVANSSAKEHEVTMKRKFYINTVFVAADQYNIIRKIFSMVGAVDQEALVLKKAGH